jgi:molybdopterin molybdotransferase
MSCAADGDPDALSPDAARARILAALQPLAGHERVPLRAALARVLDEDAVATRPVPGHANSAMDGYALRSADVATAAAVTLRVLGTALAGHPYPGAVTPGGAVRIMTGAVLPAGADAVVMQEEVLATDVADTPGGGIRLHGPLAAGLNCRLAGEDIAPGQRPLRAGRRLTAMDLGIAASLGLPELTVRRRPRVAFFSTGDELRPLGEPLAPGECHDSNRYMVQGLLTHWGAEALDLGVVRDDDAALAAALRTASAMADVVLTTGGVSVGQADRIRAVLGTVGEIHLWRVAMKPGRPLAFGQIGAAYFFGLPGNPVSAAVTLLQFVQPALRCLQGEAPRPPLTVPAVLRHGVRKRPGRVEFQRGVLAQEADGSLSVAPTGPQGSGILSSLAEADCLICLGAGQGDVAAGAVVPVQPFFGLLG